VTHWDINAQDVSCCECATPFEEGNCVVSNISEQNGEFKRRDYCQQCWDKVGTKESFYYWKSIFSREKKKSVFIDDNTLMDFFTRLTEEDSEEKQNFRYVLSLVLMRKKILKFDDVCREGDREYLLMEDKEGREYRVWDPHLAKETLADVKQQMSSILHQDFLSEEE